MQLIIEKVYVVDKSGDSRAYSRNVKTWSESLPGHSNYHITLQGDTSHIPMSGDYDYTWSVSVNFSADLPEDIGVNVSLGVIKSPAPESYLHVKAGTQQERYVVRTEKRW